MKYDLTNKRLKGFSLLEILIVMAIIGFTSVLLLPGSITQVRGTSISGRASEISSLIYQFQQNAFYGLNNQSFGIRFSTNSYTLFRGTTFAAGTNKETVTLDTGITINSVSLGGGSDLIFTLGSLKPNVNGTIRLTNSTETYQININQEGYVEYAKV